MDPFENLMEKKSRKDSFCLKIFNLDIKKYLNYSE